MNDYNFTFPFDLTIPDSSQGSLEIVIPIILDTLADDGETIELNIEAPVDVVITNPSATITITDPPADQAQITLGSSIYNVSETVGTLTVTVNYINPGASFDVTIDALISSTATADMDYVNIFPYTLNIPATSQGVLEFNVEIIADTLEESDEFIDLSLTAPGNVMVSLNSTTITITGELFVDNIISASPEILLYPNPANEYIHLVSDVMFNSIYVFNQVGQQVITEKFTPLMMKIIDAKNLTNGMYQMVIHSERGKQSMRFIVSH